MNEVVPRLRTDSTRPSASRRHRAATTIGSVGGTGWWAVGEVTGGEAIVSPQLRGASQGENLGSRWKSGTGPLR